MASSMECTISFLCVQINSHKYFNWCCFCIEVLRHNFQIGSLNHLSKIIDSSISFPSRREYKFPHSWSVTVGVLLARRLATKFICKMGLERRQNVLFWRAKCSFCNCPPVTRSYAVAIFLQNVDFPVTVSLCVFMFIHCLIFNATSMQFSFWRGPWGLSNHVSQPKQFLAFA